MPNARASVLCVVYLTIHGVTTQMKVSLEFFLLLLLCSLIYSWYSTLSSFLYYSHTHYTHTTHSQPQVLGAEYWFVVLRDFLNNIIERFLVRLALASRQSVTVLFLVSDCSAVRLSCTELCWIFCSVAQSLQHLY